jgi:assimilatory nitrate reductase catalytic subunit
MFRNWTCPEAVFQLLKSVSHGQPCEISGIEGYEMIERAGGIQWPLKEKDKGERMKDEIGTTESSSFIRHPSTFQNERRLFEDGKFFTPDTRARFMFEAPRETPEPADEHFPFVLLTGRGSSAQWHTESRTGKSAILRKLHARELFCEIHPRDAQKQGISDGTMLRVTSRRGFVSAQARLTATIQRGQVFLPMHDPRVNQLTASVFDPISRQPSYKHCAVRVERE